MARPPLRKLGPEDLAHLGDEELLDVQFRELDLKIEGTDLALRVEQLNGELASRGLLFRPHFWLSDEWFTPDGIPGVAIPFYLAHPRLARLELSQMLEVEGGDHDSCMRILRHEAGHAIDNAFQLRRQRQRRELFGDHKLPYPEHYTPKPYSKNFVLHLDSWYAQSHPDEDFAETFALWLTPDAQWRQRYQGWPALRKLEYVDQLMRSLAGRTPPVTTTRDARPAAVDQADAATALPEETPPLRGGLSELLRPRPAPPVLRRAGVRTEHDRGAVPDQDPEIRSARWSAAGPASTSTRSTRCSRT